MRSGVIPSVAAFPEERGISRRIILCRRSLSPLEKPRAFGTPVRGGIHWTFSIAVSSQFNKRDQKANVACTSMRRFDDELENGPPASPLETLNSCEPKTPPGLARFTLLKTLRTPTPSVRL